MRVGDTIYLDHQATTPVDPRVLERMLPFFTEEFGNPHSVDHIIGWKAAQALEEAASQVAHLLGADKDEIIFTSGATEANNLALLGLGKRAAGGKRHRILLSAIEHKCVLEAGRVLRDQFGYKVDLVPIDPEGRVTVAALEKALSDDVLLVSIMAVNNEIGTIQEIEKLSERVKKSGAIFHCDAAQAPCAMKLNRFAEYIDLLSLSAHKFYGPKGVGALFVKHEYRDEIEPLIYGGGQQGNVRSGTVPVPLCVGMGTAVEIMTSPQITNERLAIASLRNRFVRELQNLPWPIKINGPKEENRHPGNVNIRFEGFSAHDILGVLQPKLAASTGSACTSGITESSHVLRAMGLNEGDANSSIRFSLGRFTSATDISEAIILLEQALERLSCERIVKEA